MIVEHVEQSAVGVDKERSCEERGDGELLDDFDERWFPSNDVCGTLGGRNWLVERWRMEWQCASYLQQLIGVRYMMRR